MSGFESAEQYQNEIVKIVSTIATDGRSWGAIKAGQSLNRLCAESNYWALRVYNDPAFISQIDTIVRNMAASQARNQLITQLADHKIFVGDNLAARASAALRTIPNDTYSSIRVS